MSARPAGWQHSADSVDFPPAPWRLAGTIYLSVWRLPVEALPPACLPPGSRPATVLGQAVVGTAWAIYEPPGILAYHELLAAVLLQAGLRSRVSIVRIWVDDPASLAGGRALWAIPKELARLELRPDGGTELEARASTDDGRTIASASFGPGRSLLPVRLPLRLETVQKALADGSTSPTVARADGRAALAPCTASWTFDPAGPLGFLARATPSLSCRLARMSLRFG